MNFMTIRLVILYLLSNSALFSQEKGFKIPDSLENKNYLEIYNAHRKAMYDTVRSLIYLKTYLEKGKKDSFKIGMAMAYCRISYYQTDEKKRVQYLDSSIALSKDSNDKFYPTFAYSSKGGFYFNRFNYKDALNNYLLAMEHAKKTGNKEYVYIMKHNIGLIKDKLGKYHEALEMFKECLVYEEQKEVKSDQNIKDYLITLLAISETYSKMELSDSSSYYIKKAMPLAREKDEILYHQFVFFEGVNLYHKKNYTAAKDSIAKALLFLPLVSDKAYLVNGYFYMGKVDEALENINKANSFYKKIDSIFRITEKHITPEVRESYESLTRYYKAKKDIENQLIYVERLLKFDSIVNANREIINEKLIKEYDTAELLAEKESLITFISKKNTHYAGLIIILVGVVFLTSILLYYQYQKRKLYRSRFENLINKEKKPIENTTVKNLEQQPKEDIEISTEIVESVLLGMEKFEKKLKFLKPNITINNLATSLNTNNKYLSKIINTYKKKNFTQYINDLRIEYAIEKLQSDSKFKKYTIKAISGEIGFNTPEAFSRSFYKKTGLYPSYFIKQLEKQQDK